MRAELATKRNPILIYDTLAGREKGTWKLDSLRSEKSIGGFSDSVNNLALYVYFHSRNSEFIRYRHEIEKGVSPKKIKKALFNQDFKDTPPTKPEYDRLIAASSLKEQIKRSIIRKLLTEGENSLSLSPAERIVLLGNCDLGDQFDLFYRSWNQNEVKNPLVHKLKKMGEKEALQYLREKKVVNKDTNFLYCDLQENADGTISQFPYAVVYHKEIDAIGRTIESMCRKLDQVGTKHAKALSSYYRAYGKALTSTDLKEHEKLWQAVDIKWLRVRGRMQPIHMMESYVDAAGLRVEPELALMFLDDRYQAETEAAKKSKSQMIGWLDKEYGGLRSFKLSKKSMQQSLVGIYATPIIGGRRHTFRPAGQNVPNREEVRVQGVKIFLDMETLKQRWQTQKELLVKIFGKDYVRRMFPDNAMVIATVNRRLPGHEVAHNFLIQKGTRKAKSTRRAMGVNVYQKIEEHKSTLAITASTKALSSLEQTLYLLNLFTTCPPNLVLKSDRSRRPYLNDVLVSLNLLINSGILYKKENGHFDFDFSPEKLDSFFRGAHVVLDSLANAYDKKSFRLAQEHMSKYFQETPFIKELEKRLGVK